MADFSLKAVFGLDATGVKTELKQLRKEFNDTVNEWGKIGATAAVAAFVALSKGAVDLARDLSDTALNVGINVESLQALEAQAKRNGVSAEQMTKTLEKLNETTQKAREGDAKAVETFAKLGIVWTDIARLPLEAKYEAVGRAYHNAEDKASAYNAVCDLFGAKIGPKLIASLDELGQLGFRKVAKEAAEAGEIMKAETVAALDRAGVAIEDFKKKAEIAAGNIIINFRSEEGLKLLLFQFLKVVGQFGAGIVDAIVEGGQMAWAVLKGAFIGATNALRDGMLDAVEYFAKKWNDVLPDFLKKRGFTINIEGIEDLKSAGKSIGDTITEAIAQTSPNKFKEEVGTFWDKRIHDQQLVVDAMNRVDFGKQADQLRHAGDGIKGALSTAADKLAAAGPKLAEPIKEVVKQLGIVLAGRTGIGYEQQTTASLEGVAERLKSELLDSRSSDFNGPYHLSTAGTYVSAGTTALETELNRVTAELAQRSSVQTYAAKYGESAARAQFGDTVTSKALSNLSADSTRTANGVQSISDSLQKILGP